MVAYKGYYIEPFTIESIVYGGKTYKGFTRYLILSKDKETVIRIFKTKKSYLENKPLEIKSIHQAKIIITKLSKTAENKI